ncbi:MAG: hypothetical protein JRF02_01685 [Deltaproteobacteria bacterium]|jgi:hypothetical protein|nr:hypothetical protein [Deltaproteobacteria bacterium]
MSGVLFLTQMLTFWYGITSFLLAAILFFPVRKLLLSLNINRFQEKKKRAMTEEEILELKKKVNVIAAVVSVSFAFFYNKYIMLKFFK